MTTKIVTIKLTKDQKLLLVGVVQATDRMFLSNENNDLLDSILEAIENGIDDIEVT